MDIVRKHIDSLGAKGSGDITPRIDNDLELAFPGEHIVMVESFAVEAPASWAPTLNHEHDEYRWCSLADALELLHWPEVKDGLRVLARRLAAA